ncbi:YqiA/YcfP family alpha/beta fold hydrolase [Salinicola avicenniae]|uniref:YqiA/YcfP family alpha/beta fold hydrolase n=1 Tax=Salinicola avicenniae TaxID=2916836 RepID=UPI0020743DF9|nr:MULTISPECIES: YqiA/YcfP family alpha/beta fold hydrolase [unclassified Salinicola]
MAIDAHEPPREPVEGLLYLHGFNSGSASPKAQLIREACATLAAARGQPLRCLTPHLSHRPKQALAQASEALSELGDNTLLVGSSMGGFLATCLAEEHALPAVLINPAVKPARFVADYLGQTLVNDYTGESFMIESAHHAELTAMQWCRILHPERYLLLLGSADETLDCRDALRTYAGCRTLIHPGGDHGFSELARYLPALFAHGGWQWSS